MTSSNILILVFSSIFAAILAAHNKDLLIEDGCHVTEYEKVRSAAANCSNLIIDGITVPGGVTLTVNLRDGANLTFAGQTKFEFYSWKGPLMRVGGNNVFVQQEEGSILDGQGHLYWDGQGDWGTIKPRFFFVDNARKGSEFRNIYLKNCPAQCVHITDSSDVLLDGWTIDVSEGDEDKTETGHAGHNTDGFDVASTGNLLVENAIVHNQDDCVCVNQGSNITFRNLYCHGSHGISLAVGLSTNDSSINQVADVFFYNITLEGGENAIHVKTLPAGAPGYIKNVHYENIVFSGATKYGVNIEEDYEGGGGNGNPSGNIVITDLILTNVTGTVSESAVPVYVLCGDGGCANWTWSQVTVTGKKSNSCNFKPSGFSC